MKAELEAVGKIIAAAKTETLHLKVVRSLFQQIEARWAHHEETAKRIEDQQAAAEKAKLEEAAKLVQQAEQQKANEAAALANGQDAPPQNT